MHNHYFCLPNSQKSTISYLPFLFATHKKTQFSTIQTITAHSSSITFQFTQIRERTRVAMQLHVKRCSTIYVDSDLFPGSWLCLSGCCKSQNVQIYIYSRVHTRCSQWDCAGSFVWANGRMWRISHNWPLHKTIYLKVQLHTTRLTPSYVYSRVVCSVSHSFKAPHATPSFEEKYYIF